MYERRGSMIAALKKFLNIATTVLLVLFVAFVILLFGVRFVGIEPHIVLSGSMEPEIWTGSIVYVKSLTPTEAQQLKAGQDVTYVVNKQGTKVTHRIYEVVGTAYVKDQNGNYILDDNGEKVPAIDQNGNQIVMYTTYGINNGGTLDGEKGVGNLASSNVIGKPVFSIPLLGYVANFVQTPNGRIIPFGFCFLLIVASIFSGSGKNTKDKKSKSSQENDAAEQSSEPIKPIDSSENLVKNEDASLGSIPSEQGSAEDNPQ
jgi:signal peptidase